MTDPKPENARSAAALLNEFSTAARAQQEKLAELLGAARRALGSRLDPLNVSGAFASGMAQLLSNPVELIESNVELWQSHMALWQRTALRLLGRDSDPVVAPAGSDRRFRHKDWDEKPVFDFIKQSYLLTSRWMMDTMTDIEGLSAEDKHKIRFHTQQIVDAFSPSNFLLTNPEVLQATIDSRGQNLVRGLKNLARDLADGGGSLRIRMTNPDAFEIGRNIATTPGKVVYQNELVQLIQYEPSTAEVYRRPLLIVPPWINKYYILDLQPKNSFIRFAVEQGYTVFVVSWVNPDEELADKTFADYMHEGVLDSIGAVQKATGEDEVNLIGYCIGGTLTGATLAYMAATGDRRVKSTTFFNAQMDFSEAGDLKVFIDEAQLESLDRRMAKKGYLEGSAMATSFNMLRANDLIWSFYVDNYLLGKDPLEFDLLYWNSDSTRMPRETHMYYLRECYLRNNLAKPGGITLDGVPIDLGKVDIPLYIQAAREDHIAPFNSVFKSMNLFSGPARFMLAGSGHIAGVVNPPAANKYGYCVNEEQPRDLAAWLDGAVEHPGSWWGDWDRWLAGQSGEKVAARVPGSGELKVIEPAPGRYARERS